MGELSTATSTETSDYDVSILIVSYNTREMTLACLESVFRETRNAHFEILLVDNASTDGSAHAIRSQYPRIRLIASGENLGFAAANNLAASEASGKYLLLLNPDTLILNGAVDKMVAFADKHPDAAIVGGRTVFENGELNPTSCWRAPSLWGFVCRAIGLDALFPTSRLFNHDSYAGWKRDNEREVEIVSGCFLLIRRSIWERLEGFDRAFFMYAEDWDLCMRTRRLGYRCLMCPDAEIVHYGGASEPVKADKMIRLFVTKAQLCRKHWSRPTAWMGIRLLDLWALTRIFGYGVVKLFRPTKLRQYTCWKEVWAGRSQWRSAQLATFNASQGTAEEPSTQDSVRRLID